MQDCLLNNDAQSYTIPRWSDLQGMYDAKWQEEKEKFHRQVSVY